MILRFYRELVKQMMKMGIRVMMKVLVKLPSEAWKKMGSYWQAKKIPLLLRRKEGGRELMGD